MNKMDEQILAVDRLDLFEDETLTFQGIVTDENIVKRIMKKFDNYFEVRRGDAEDNPRWKQPIPYVVVKRGDEVFLYRRLKAGGESRLHDQLSIGIGGHMNRVNDVRNWDTNLIMNLGRELYEELDFTKNDKRTINFLGLINDDSTDVSLVHIGILAVVEISENDDVSVRETDKLEGHWVRIRDLRKEPLFQLLETWSQLAVEVL